jgi:hypothetical protein
MKRTTIMWPQNPFSIGKEKWFSWLRFNMKARNLVGKLPESLVRKKAWRGQVVHSTFQAPFQINKQPSWIKPTQESSINDIPMKHTFSPQNLKNLDTQYFSGAKNLQSNQMIEVHASNSFSVPAKRFLNSFRSLHSLEKSFESQNPNNKSKEMTGPKLSRKSGA